jgi:penicillin-binding protein 1C
LLGIDGVAVVVLDVSSSEVLAMVGSADPEDPVAGQVNAATSPRQPGSLLKPFIYARGFDAGLLTPDSMVYDVPGSWRDYRPENFDREFMGPMPAAEALRESRNLPAVRLLATLGPASLARDLGDLGVRLSGAPEQYGLSLALGSAETRLLDVAGAYAALARGGEWRPVRALAGEPPAQSRRVFSTGAAYLALRCLGAPAEGGPPSAAWKTGTSWNFRDAWAVAVTPSRAVAVWCGRTSGGGHPALVGARAALPLALKLVAEVGGRETWKRPESVRIRQVCTLSGAPATLCCERVVEAEFLPGVSSEAPCALHRRLSDGRIATVWPPEVAAWLSARKEPAAADAARKPALAITSPRNGAEYVLPRRGAKGGALPLSAATSPESGSVCWFVDGQLWKRAAPGESTDWPLCPGRHEVLACDERGASARAGFTVGE